MTFACNNGALKTASVQVDVISNIQNSNPVVFEEVFIHWQPHVYTYFIRRTKNLAFAEELTQLTFIKLWDFRHTLSPDHSLETQLFRIARTTMIDGIREQQRRKRLQQELEKPGEEAAHTAIHALDMAGAINALPPVRKKVFLLNRMHGYSYKEIASELSLSDRTVEKHISLALKQLRKILTPALLLFCFQL